MSRARSRSEMATAACSFLAAPATPSDLNLAVGINILFTGNKVQGNLIGTDVTGTLALGNGNRGVFVSGGSGNTVRSEFSRRHQYLVYGKQGAGKLDRHGCHGHARARKWQPRRVRFWRLRQHRPI